MQRHLRKTLKLRHYKPRIVHTLTPRHEQQRVEFCRWFLGKGKRFLRQLITGDEKNWYLRRRPHNMGTWAASNPNVLLDVKCQGAKKYMCSVLVDGEGKVLEPYWFEDVEGRPISQNGPGYLECLQNHFMPKFSQRQLRRKWWQQDGKWYCKKAYMSSSSSSSLEILGEFFL